MEIHFSLAGEACALSDAFPVHADPNETKYLFEPRHGG
jgi:hypothetical protein